MKVYIEFPRRSGKQQRQAIIHKITSQLIISDRDKKPTPSVPGQEIPIVRTFEKNQLNVPWAPNPYTKLAQEYHQLTEEFDRAVCTGDINGVAIPKTAQQALVINVYAKIVRTELALRENLDNDQYREFQKAIFDTAPRNK